MPNAEERDNGLSNHRNRIQLLCGPGCRRRVLVRDEGDAMTTYKRKTRVRPLLVAKLPHRYELHRTNTYETNDAGRRFRYCVYDYFNVNGQTGLSFWYFVTKQDALSKYPECEVVA